MTALAKNKWPSRAARLAIGMAVMAIVGLSFVAFSRSISYAGSAHAHAGYACRRRRVCRHLDPAADLRTRDCEQQFSRLIHGISLFLRAQARPHYYHSDWAKTGRTMDSIASAFQ